LSIEIVMIKRNAKLTAVDLFAGAGGLSLGFKQAGFRIVFAVEKEIYCAETYKKNHGEMNIKVILEDISKTDFLETLKENRLNRGDIDILLSGPPCQGFSISNMRTRSMDNPHNHLFKEFIRAVEEIYPKWILFENVSGIVNFEKCEIVETIKNKLEELGYSCVSSVLNAADYGVPQIRRRFFIVGNRMDIQFSLPSPSHGFNGKPYVTVRDAIFDLPILENGNKYDCLQYQFNNTDITEYQREMRKNYSSEYCMNNQVTKNNNMVIDRYKFIPPGGNWEHIPSELMQNYKNRNNCHSGIYKRLKWDEPSIVISNFRKNMLIHPEQHRGLSIREAARLQSFPDNYIFFGSLGDQQQQVANAVPPLLARSIAAAIRGAIECGTY